MNISSILRKDTSYFTGVRLVAITIVLYLTEHYLYDGRTVQDLGIITPAMIAIIGVVVALLYKKECVSHGLDYRFSSVIWWLVGSGVVVGVVSYLVGGDGFKLLTVCLYVGGVVGTMMNPMIQSKEGKDPDFVETEE